MITIDTTSDEYFKLRLEFTYKSTDPMARPWDTFIPWLETQGGRIEPKKLPVLPSGNVYGCDTLGIVGGMQKIVFDDDKQYVWFKLRYL